MARVLRDNELLSDAEVAAIFESWDKDHDGRLSLEEIVAGLKQLRLPCSPSDVAYYSERFKSMDRNHDGSITKAELSLTDFFVLVREKEVGLRAVFDALDADHSGFLDMEELRRALQSLNVPYDDRAVERLYRRMDKNRDGKISFSEFREVLLLVPDYSLAAVMDYWQQAALLNVDDEGFAVPTEAHAGREAALNSVAGGLASVLSKTSTAPIERLKILFQQHRSTPPSMWGTLKNIYATEGVRGLFRGNLVNLMKSSPESAVKFAVFERCKQLLDPTDTRQLSGFEMFACGGAGGVAAHASGFPLEVTKTKLAGSPAGTYKSLVDCVRTVYRTEGGILAFYRGLTPVLLSTIPHAGTTLSTYQMSKDKLTEWSGEERTPAWALVAAATVSTVCGTTVATPLHTRIIMRQAPEGALALIRDIWRHEGAAGFTRGFAPSMVKGIPAHIATFGVFEFFRIQFGISKPHKHKHGHKGH